MPAWPLLNSGKGPGLMRMAIHGSAMPIQGLLTIRGMTWTVYWDILGDEIKETGNSFLMPRNC